MTALRQPVIRSARFFLAHAPGLVRHGSKPSRDIAREASVGDLIRGALRPWEHARDYAPNQVLLGARHPDSLWDLPRPWSASSPPGDRRGPHGEIAPEEDLYGLLKIADQFDLVQLEAGFVEATREALAAHPLVAKSDLEALGPGVSAAAIEARLAGPVPTAPLHLRSGRRIGCIAAGHETDLTLTPDVLLENLAAKVTAAMALRALLAGEAIEPGSVDYVIGSGEEAVGDRYQRGGGNLAKAVAEQAGCLGATGVDVKGFCCGPIHALAIAGSLVAAGVFSRVAVIGGCALAKLGMKYQGHLRHGQPVLEDTLVGVAIVVEGDDGRSPRLRLDAIGRHRVAAGSSQKAILESLVRDPLRALGWSFRDVDKYATELHNPELTEPSGSGDVPQLNYKAIGGLAALEREIAPTDVAAFARAHGLPGFSPTQGHIASAIPFLGHALDGLRSGSYRRVLFLAKGSLFLGRMTQMADGISVIVERHQ
ncbi:MAG TPA: glycine/sarcosine/betaine reductase complex component C subunit beta [Candidatus Bathyarchaeia archaeon]|nr:glycine/sarcosine/betaine reductase complex component C subunit beta [Candidatus Bathyarchaeia archaeon]